MNKFRCGLLCSSVLLSACQGDAQLPAGATLAITPSDKRITVDERVDAQGRCLFDPERFVDVPIVVTLKDSGGSALGGVNVRLYVDFADNTFGPISPLALFEDRNANGIVDADSELVSGETDAIAEVRMDAVGGAGALLLRMNLSCSFRSGLFAYVDGVTASASIQVDRRNAIDAERTEEVEDDGASQNRVARP